MFDLILYIIATPFLLLQIFIMSAMVTAIVIMPIVHLLIWLGILR